MCKSTYKQSKREKKYKIFFCKLHSHASARVLQFYVYTHAYIIIMILYLIQNYQRELGDMEYSTIKLIKNIIYAAVKEIQYLFLTGILKLKTRYFYLLNSKSLENLFTIVMIVIMKMDIYMFLCFQLVAIGKMIYLTVE